jgi:hypothetical protein
MLAQKWNNVKLGIGINFFQNQGKSFAYLINEEELPD